MTTIRLDRSQYTVLPDEGVLPPELEGVFQSTKRRLEGIAGVEIDIESKEGKERFNYAVFKAVIVRMYENLEDPSMPRHVANAVRRLLSEINAKFEFRSPKEALSYKFQNGLTLLESLYECGYYDGHPTVRKASDERGGQSVVDPKKNVESIVKLAKALELPETDPERLDALRMAGAFNRAIEADGSPCMDCRIASSHLLKMLLDRESMDPNAVIGSYGETAFYLMAKYMVDPANYDALNWAARNFKQILSKFDPYAKVLRVINPHVVDRKGVGISKAMKAQADLVSRNGADPELIETAYRRTHWFLKELEGDWDLITEHNNDSPEARKIREFYGVR